MSDNGITACVGDNSVADEKPTFAYHGYYTTQATNGFVSDRSVRSVVWFYCVGIYLYYRMVSLLCHVKL